MEVIYIIMSKRKEILTLFDQGVKQPEIVKQLGISRQYVSQVLISEERLERVNPIDPERVKALYESGIKPGDIATKMNTKVNVIREILGLPVKPSIDKDIILSSFERNKSALRVSKELNIPYSTVFAVLKREGIVFKRGRSYGS